MHLSKADDWWLSQQETTRTSLHSASTQRFCQEHFPTKGDDKPHCCHHCHRYRHEHRRTVWQCKDCEVFATGKYDFPATSAEGQVAKGINKSSNWVVLPNHHKHGVPPGHRKLLLESFKCDICHVSPIEPPVIFPKCCCEVCADTWYCQDDKAYTCLMCRAERAYSNTTPLQGLDDLVKGLGPILGREPPTEPPTEQP